jgi:hypothetical protein
MFLIVIYDLNSIGLYYKTTILVNLPLDRSIIYDHKVTPQTVAYLLRL